jgi:hypothetical protein
MRKFSWMAGYAFGVAIGLAMMFVFGYIFDANWFEKDNFEAYVVAFASTGVIAAILSLKE